MPDKSVRALMRSYQHLCSKATPAAIRFRGILVLVALDVGFSGKVVSGSEPSEAQRLDIVDKAASYMQIGQPHQAQMQPHRSERARNLSWETVAVLVLFFVSLGVWLHAREVFRGAEDNIYNKAFRNLVTYDPKYACYTGTTTNIQNKRQCGELAIVCEGKEYGANVVLDRSTLNDEFWPVISRLQSCNLLGGWKTSASDTLNTTRRAEEALKDFSMDGHVGFKSVVVYADTSIAPWIGRKVPPPALGGMMRVEAVNEHSYFWVELRTQDKGDNCLDENGALSKVAKCPGTGAYVSFPWCIEYECIDGADLLYLSYFNDHVAFQKRIQKFDLLSSRLSFDELFAVYTGLVGVFIAAVFAVVITLCKWLEVGLGRP